MSIKQNKAVVKREKSLLANYKKWSESRHPYLDFIMDETDIGKWWVRIRDLDNEFKGGEYIVHMWAPKDYPFGPPEFYFKTATGVYGIDCKVCISIGEYHKSDYAAGQGGMGGFAAQLLNGIIFWSELGTGINILHQDFHMASKATKEIMKPRIQEEMKAIAARSRDDNIKRFGDLIKQFDELPWNVFYREIDRLKDVYSSRVCDIMKRYITAN